MRRGDAERKWEATKEKREATTAGNLGESEARRGIVRGHEERTIGTQGHRGHAQANALSGNKMKLGLNDRGCLELGDKGVRVGILTGRMSTRGRRR